MQFPGPLTEVRSADGDEAPAPELVERDIRQGGVVLPETRFSATPTSSPTVVGGVVDQADKVVLDDTRASIQINIEDIQLPAFINEVFGNVLKLSFEIEDALKSKSDRVTVRLDQPQTAQMVFDVSRQILTNYGVEILRQGDVLRFQVRKVGLSPDEPPILISGDARPEVPIAYRPVFQFIPLHNVDARDVIPWLNSAYEKSGLSVSADTARSGLMLKGMSSIVRQASEAVRLLDQPFMRGRHSMRIDPAFITAADLAEQLKTLISAQGYSISIGQSSGSIVLVPLESSNGLIVFANEGSLLGLVREWAQQVDRIPVASAVVGQGEASEKEGLFYYEARNTRVTELAKTLRALVSGISGEGAYGITSDLKNSASSRASASTSKRQSGENGARAPAPTLLQAAGAAALIGGQNNLLESLASDINGSGIIVEDENRNALLFRGSARTWQQMQELILHMDKPARQVLIEVTVASVNLSDSKSVGTEWKFLNGDFSNAKLSGSMGEGGFNYVINTAGGNMAAIAALAKDQRVRVLATPRILVKSGEQANINVGSDIPVPTAQINDDSTTGGTTNLRNEIAYRSTGTILNVAPVVYSNNRVDLTVSQELSDGGGASGGGDGSVTAPIISRTSLETALTLKSGGSVLMGGLIRDNVSDSNAGVPILKDLPWIGGLFGRQQIVKDREEVILLIQPYVLESDEDAKEVTAKLRTMLDHSLACSGAPGKCGLH
jgi:general secretion pathway protein D